jgi:DNA modification methylase
MLEPLIFHTEKRKVRELIPYEKNPRFLTPEQELQLTTSLKKFSLVEIPAIDLDNTLIAGHQRVMIMMKLGKGEEEIDVRVPNRKLTDEEFKEYNIRSNANTGSWDINVLANEFEAPLLDDWGLDTSKIKGFPTDNTIEEEKEVPTPIYNETSLVKRGDMFQLGNHVFICGDAKDKAVLSSLLKGKKAQMVFSDPPYNVKVDTIVNLGKTQHREFKEASGEMTEAEFIDFLTMSLQNLKDNSADGSIHYICMDWKHIYELLTASRSVGFEFKQLCVWNKDNGGMGTFYRSKHELIFVFKNGKAKHINNFELGQNGRYRTNVWDYAGANTFTTREKTTTGKTVGVGDLEWHPTVKPLNLVSDAVLDCSNREGLVLDTFLGSGTTLIACERTGRVCYGVELDEAYCEVIIKRFHHFMQQQSKPTPFIHLNGDLTISDIVS